MEQTALILHLEDSDLDAALIADRLAKNAPWATVERVPDRERYVAALQARRFDLILSDFQVPGLSDFDALELAIEHQPDTPFLFLSGALGEEVAVDALQRGAKDYILKERMARLVPAIERALEVARSRIREGQTENLLRKREAELAAELAATTRLHALSSRLLSATDIPTALDDVLSSAIATSGADFGNIQLYNATAGTLEIVSHQDFGAEFVEYFRSVRVEGSSACARALQADAQISIEDVLRDAAYAPHVAIALRAGYRSVTSTPLKGHDGAMVGMLSVHFREPHQLSARDSRLLELFARNAADMLERLRFVNALKDADRRKDEFLATLAHELRNPLAPIYSGLRLMRMASASPQIVEQARGIIERQAAQLKRLVDDLMDISRISRGLMELRKETVDLNTVVLAAIEASRPLIEQRKHQLEVSVSEEPATLHGDPIRLTQVLLNLLNNAAKYSEQAGRIQLSTEVKDTEVIISVKDAGIGIPPDRLQDIFEIFTQVDRSIEKSHGGLGIGLSLVKNLVEMHGGRIEALSEGPGTGAEFIITLPLHEASASPELPAAAQSANSEPHRILVVDDNREAADTLSQLLGIMGNEARVAYDGESAISAAREFLPEVVLLDIGMPKLNGLDACKRIRQQPWGRDMTLIAVTGWGQEADLQRSREAGFNEHMVKPVDADQLMSVLSRARLHDR